MEKISQIKKSLSDSALTRWSVMLLVGLVMFATYYFYDVFSTIKVTLQKEVGLSNAEYGLWYGTYSFANFFLLMAFLGGIILDKWGVKKTGLLFFSFMSGGVFLTAYGASEIFKPGALGYAFMGSFLKSYSPELKMMILGRVLFGMGAETCYVLINKVLVKWFKGKELALAMGLSLSLARFGTACALLLSPRLIQARTGWTTAGWFGAMLVGVSLLAFLTYLVLDTKFDKLKKEQAEEKEEEFHFSDVLKLFTNPSFILITLLCVTFYSGVFPFVAFAADLMENKFGLSSNISSLITTILPFGTIIGTPLFGWIADKKGKSASLMILGSFLLILVFLTMSLTYIPPYIPMLLLGISFSLVPAAMWPSVAKIVGEKSLGTAYGLMFFIQNAGLFGIPWLIGKVLDMTNPGITAEMVDKGQATLDYTYAILILAVLGVLGLIFAFLLKQKDKTSGYGLELPNKIE